MRDPRRVRSTIALLGLGLGAIVCAPATARADSATADALFKQAKELMKDGKIPEACARFEASYNEDPLMGALLNLADCREQQGRLASAWARFGEAIERAKKTGDNRQEYAQKRRDAITPRLPALTITVTNPVAKLTIYRGDQALDPGAYNTPLPIDPGETIVQVTEGDDVLWQQSVKLGEGEKQDVKVDMQLIYDSAPAVKKKRAKGAEGGGISIIPTPFWNAQRISGLVIGAAGVAGAIAGFTLGGLALGEKSTVDSNCTDTNKTGKRFCTPAGSDAAINAQNLANASQWTLIASGAVAAVGVTLFFTAPSSALATEPLEKRASIEPRFTFAAPVVGPNITGVVVGGTF